MVIINYTTQISRNDLTLNNGEKLCWIGVIYKIRYCIPVFGFACIAGRICLYNTSKIIYMNNK